MYLMCIPKCILDSFGIRVKYMHNVKDTCILLECNRACKIHLRYIRIHSGYVYPSGYMQDTCKIHQDTYRIGNYTKSYRKQHVTPVGGAGIHTAGTRMTGTASSTCIQVYRSLV